MIPASRYIATAVVTVAIFAAIAAFLWIVYEVQRSGELTLFVYMLILPVIAAVGAAVALLSSVRRFRNLGASVLFCRRFAQGGETERRNRWFEDILVEACRGIVVPITLRDASIPAPASFSTGISAVSKVIGTIVVILLIVLILTVIQWIAPELPWAARLLGLAIGLIGGIVFAVRIPVWLRDAIANQSAAAFGAVIRRIMTNGYSRFDILVLRSTDADWKRDVERILEDASFAIVDVTEASDSINWESRRSLEMKGQDRVLFLSTSIGDRGIGRVSSWIEDCDGDLLVMRIPANVTDGGAANRDRHTCHAALRKWLLGLCLVGREELESFGQDHDLRLLRAKHWAASAYAIPAGVVAILVFWRPDVLSVGETIASVILVVVTVYLTARLCYARAALGTEVLRAMLRGAAVGMISFVLLFMLFGIGSRIGFGSDFFPDIPAFLWVVAVAAYSIVLAVIGSVVGLVIEIVLFRHGGFLSRNQLTGSGSGSVH